LAVSAEDIGPRCLACELFGNIFTAVAEEVATAPVDEEAERRLGGFDGIAYRLDVAASEGLEAVRDIDAFAISDLAVCPVEDLNRRDSAIRDAPSPQDTVCCIRD
jgi:hypothetical protein